MTIEATEYVRPSWRDMNIDLLAQRLYSAHTNSLWGAEFDLDGTAPENKAAWLAAAEAAVEMIVDEPEKEFQAQIDKVLSGEPNEILTLNSPVTESQAAREWREAKASDWV